MDIPASVFNEDWLWLTSFLYLLLLGHAARHAAWGYVHKHIHVYLGAIVFASLIWILRAGIGSNLNFHFLGITVMTLMFGWRLALVAATAIVSITFWRLEAGLLAVPINTLVMGGIPIVVTYALLRWSQRHLPTNIFVFVFVNAFLAAVLSTVAVIGVGSLLLWWTGTFSAYYLQTYYLPYIPLLMFPEGLINGMLTAIAVVYAPQWIPVFDDARYLRKRGE
ncbi:energy-coupling factor ABC transporter permease [Thiothrix nivea]|uniref:Integral membrane protein n=1 Tax=Thiothrix nivea (strain ATCC 35100 / DSM 5205 / JP2) TaxID=870187 RepID=A0A656HF02_THINJ|nr:energy-coupling factor ABC transporter permease [Thiothrix nivea]EIJ35007.1 integral membrane protein [Thiothrix nivea DSM 5205]